VRKYQCAWWHVVLNQAIIIRDMHPEDEEFVGSCTHVNETAEWTASCARRVPWLRAQREQGLRVKVALLQGRPVGFLYLMPIETASWGLVGRELMVIQCLVVVNEVSRQGIGRALVSAATEETRRQGRKGLTVAAYYHDFWFMPAPFFEKCGFSVVERQGTSAVLWKVLDPSTSRPGLLSRTFTFRPVRDRVVIDLFWTRSCLTTDTEAQRVRGVAAEFADSVVLREYCSDDPGILSRYGITRAIFINGREVDWGYEAPKDGLREEIRKAMLEHGTTPRALAGA
jgi:GNAT superfamily N-acetyltransferase